MAFPQSALGRPQTPFPVLTPSLAPHGGSGGELAPFGIARWVTLDWPLALSGPPMTGV